MKWSENMITRALALQTFNRKHLVVVPNCIWTGYECDLLVVTPNLRIIDVEVKISRADLKADSKKDKWWRSLTYAEAQEKGYDTTIWNPWKTRERANWPRKIWKHYYAMPAEIWTPELLPHINEHSGVLLLKPQQGGGAEIVVKVERPAKPNRDAETISAANAIDIARLASLRMWESFKQLEDERKKRVTA